MSHEVLSKYHRCAGTFCETFVWGKSYSKSFEHQKSLFCLFTQKKRPVFEAFYSHKQIGFVSVTLMTSLVRQAATHVHRQKSSSIALNTRWVFDFRSRLLSQICLRFAFANSKFTEKQISIQFSREVEITLAPAKLCRTNIWQKVSCTRTDWQRYRFFSAHDLNHYMLRLLYLPPLIRTHPPLIWFRLLLQL